jgi:succinoglycan biosynthesis protein ExoM
LVTGANGLCNNFRRYSFYLVVPQPNLDIPLMKISVCIATFRRPEKLALLLDDLSRQERLPDEVIVVDNEALGGARIVIERKQSTAPFPIKYAIQPERGIALTRNMTVKLADCDWIAFIDDDERAPTSWLRQLVAAADQYEADGVLAPVVPVVPESAPAWIRNGSFYDFPRSASGTIVPLNRMRFGNVLLRGDPLRREPGPFDTAYQLMTGEDCDLLSRMANHGAKIIWCDEAIVTEPIEAKRLALKWILMRALSGGQEFARNTLDGTYGKATAFKRIQLFGRALLQLISALGLAVVTLPLGRHRAAQWLMRAWANLGKLSVFWGWKYQAYA